MPDKQPLDHTAPEPPKHRRHHSRPRSGVSRRISSLRRSQRRLTGEDQSRASAAPDVSVAPPPTNAEDGLETARSTRSRLRASLMHPGRGQILAAVILFVVGAAGAMQIRINATDDTYASARREDLIQLLDGLSSESRRLEGEITQLEQTRSNLARRSTNGPRRRCAEPAASSGLASSRR